MEAYLYSPVQSNQIRVLILEGTDSESDVLSAHLEVVELDKVMKNRLSVLP